MHGMGRKKHTYYFNHPCLGSVRRSPVPVFKLCDHYCLRKRVVALADDARWLRPHRACRSVEAPPSGDGLQFVSPFGNAHKNSQMGITISSLQARILAEELQSGRPVNVEVSTTCLVMFPCMAASDCVTLLLV